METGFALDWRTVDHAVRAEHPDLLRQIAAGHVDGVTVRSVLSTDEAASVARNLASAAWSGWTFGALIGMSLGMVGPDEPDLCRYYDDAERSRALYRIAFGCDPHDRIATALAPMAGGRPLVPASEGSRSYNPGQLRRWEPGRGGLPAHVGNEFHFLRDDVSTRQLASTTSVEDHLSYFLVLQAPGGGGSLRVYDLTFDEDDGTRRDPFGPATRDDSDFDDLDCICFDPDPGDLIVFRGGHRWHRVDPVSAFPRRITYGGFCGLSTDRTEFHLWS